MALVRLLGVEHLPSGISVGTFNTCYGLTQSDLGAAAQWTSDTATYPQVAHLRVEGNVLQFGGRKETMAAHGAGVASIPMNKLMGSIDPNKLIIGFRMLRLTTPENNIPFFSLDTGQFGGIGGTGIPGNQLLVFATTDSLGVPYYYELVFDFTTGKYDIYRDGALTTSQAAIPSGITKTTIKNYYWCFGRYDVYHVPPGTDIKQFILSDIYVIADTGISGDTDVNRLGPITLKKLNVISSTGDGWNPTPGLTILEAVNTRRDINKLISPYVAAPVDRTPLRVKLKNSDLNGASLKGVYVGTTAFRDSGVTDGMTAKVSYNSQDSTAVTLANLSTSTPQDQKVFSGTKAPDGTALNINNVGSLEIVFTPTA